MDWTGFRRLILSQHSGKPQEMAYLKEALDSMESGLSVLVRMGHHYHLAEGEGTAHPEWPKTYFHVESAPNGRLVLNEFELYELGIGWCETLEEAQHRDGIVQQMRGRGGVRRPSQLPMVISESETMDQVIERRAAEYRKQREARIARQQEKANGRTE